MTKPIEDRYLGDGVYASFDGDYIWLDLRGQDTTTEIALEPAVLTFKPKKHRNLILFALAKLQGLIDRGPRKPKASEKA